MKKQTKPLFRIPPFPILFLGIVCFLLSSCAHKISRVDYEKPSPNAETVCDVEVAKFAPISSSETKKLGSLKLKDSGFSVSCNEVDAIYILKREACAIGGNYVNIIAEERPNMASSCYRCMADIYYVGNDSLLAKAPAASKVDFTEVVTRTEEDKKRNRSMFWTSFAVGFVIGFIVVL